MLTTEERQEKLETLADISGYDTVDEMILASLTDSVCPAICINPDCDYSEDMEPDQDQGWCAVCGTNTMHSALVLAEVI